MLRFLYVSLLSIYKVYLNISFINLLIVILPFEELNKSFGSSNCEPKVVSDGKHYKWGRFII